MPPEEPPVLRGERVLLRQPILDRDVAARLEVPPDPELRRMYGQSGPPSPPTETSAREALRAIAEHDRSKGRQFVIAALVWPDGRPVEQLDGRYVGHLRLTVFSWEDGNARLAIGIYDR